MAEPWIGESAVMEWINAMSSTQLRHAGRGPDPFSAFTVLLKVPARFDNTTLITMTTSAKRLYINGLVVHPLHVWFVIKRVDVWTTIHV